MMTDRWCCPYTVLERFERLPFKKKIYFTHKNYSESKSCKEVSKCTDNGSVWVITDIINIFGKRLYQFAEDFNYIEWLNNAEEE